VDNLPCTMGLISQLRMLFRQFQWW